ncbi:MAG: LLM class F420-dependent oxidoreductase [Acidimicrobiia bacterium]|jgi:probable F420-dependent oxidoreductase
MKLGVLPRFHESAITDPEWVRGFGTLCEEVGVESVWSVEHVLVAEDYEPRYSYSADGRMPGSPGTVMPDPLEWLAYFAAVTSTVKLGTSVVVIPLHAPLVLAKRVATLDALSGGRVMFGVGLGWQIEEYRAVGVPYEERGARADEAIEVLRACWAPDPVEYSGPFTQVPRASVLPKPVQGAAVPIVIGGSTRVAARRAGRLGDGFFPYVCSPEDLADRVDVIRATATEHGRDPDAIELTVWPASFRYGSAFDLDLAKQYADLGVTRFVVSAQEASGDTFDDLRRFLTDYREQVLDQL